MAFNYQFSFREALEHRFAGELYLAEPEVQSKVQYRQGRITVENGRSIDVSLCSSAATSAFIYTSQRQVNAEYLTLMKLNDFITAGAIRVPGQLILGAERTYLVQRGVADLLSSPACEKLFASANQENVITLPVLREGIKYGLSENIFNLYGCYCNEVVSDAHHIDDESNPIYKRRVTQTIFKDADLTAAGRKQINTALVADSIASGTVILGVLTNLRKRLKGVERLELIAPLATLRGLARIALHLPEGIQIRAHVFETLLNPLPPDYYYSAHFPEPEFHINQVEHQRYSDWWGNDSQGRAVADTACAGYGWSEAFFAPEMQIQMIEAELQQRHGLSLKDVVLRANS
jgi:hypothetical protein